MFEIPILTITNHITNNIKVEISNIYNTHI